MRVQELRTTAKGGGDSVLAALVSGEHWLQNVHKLSYSFADALLKSDAPLRLAPSQQALGALIHALVKYGFPRAAALERYARLSSQLYSGPGAPSISDLQSKVEVRPTCQQQ